MIALVKWFTSTVVVEALLVAFFVASVLFSPLPSTDGNFRTNDKVGSDGVFG